MEPQNFRRDGSLGFGEIGVPPKIMSNFLASKKVLSNSLSFYGLDWINLSFYQHLCGLFIAGNWLLVTEGCVAAKQILDHVVVMEKSMGRTLVTVGLANLCGNLTTNAAFALLKSR